MEDDEAFNASASKFGDIFFVKPGARLGKIEDYTVIAWDWSAEVPADDALSNTDAKEG